MSDELIIEEKTKDSKNYLIIHVPEQFVFGLYRSFRDISENRITEKCSVIVDLRSTVNIDSAALGMLILLKHSADNYKANVTLTGASQAVLTVLKVAKFETLFKIEADTIDV